MPIVRPLCDSILSSTMLWIAANSPTPHLDRALTNVPDWIDFTFDRVQKPSELLLSIEQLDERDNQRRLRAHMKRLEQRALVQARKLAEHKRKTRAKRIAMGMPP